MKVIRKLIHKFENLCHWFPVIWQDCDFDYSYLLIILYHKLKAMHQFFLSDYTWTVDAKATAAQIRVVLDALEKLINDDYCDDIDFSSDIVAQFIDREKQRDADLHIVFNILEEKVIEWWD